MPVQDISAAVAFCGQRLGFTREYADDGFAKLRRGASSCTCGRPGMLLGGTTLTSPSPRVHQR